jgi:hypothetical protein
MQRIPFIIVTALGILLGSCLSPHYRAIALQSYVQVDGPYAASLSKTDVRRIIELSYTRDEIRKPVYRIYAEAADQVDVSAGRPQNTGDIVTGFKVRRKDGNWIIITGSIYDTEVIITS